MGEEAHLKRAGARAARVAAAAAAHRVCRHAARAHASGTAERPVAIRAKYMTIRGAGSVLETQAMRGVDLSHNLLGDKALRTVTQCLARNHHLAWLRLAGNDELGTTAGVGGDLGAVVAKCTNLTHLDVTVRDASAGSATGGERAGFAGKRGAKGKARAAREAKTKAKASKRGRTAATRASSPRRKGKRGAVGDSSGEQLAAALASAGAGSGLVSLGLPGSQLHRSVPSTLVHELPGLTALDLSGCFIGAFGAEAIAKALPRNSTLACLDLSYCGLNDLNAPRLFEAMQVRATVTGATWSRASVCSWLTAQSVAWWRRACRGRGVRTSR